MTDNDPQPLTADEFKEALRPLKIAVARLPENCWHADQAAKALDQVKDYGLRSIENGAPSGKAVTSAYPGGAISGH